MQRAETLSMSQAQRLLLKDGNLAHFTLSPSSTTMPNITAGLPAQVIKYTYWDSVHSPQVRTLRRR